MEGLGEDLIGEVQGAAEQEFVFHAGEAAQLCLVGKNRVFGHRVREDDLRHGSAQPRPMPVGGDRGWMLAEQGQPDRGNRRDHRHAYFPRIQNNEGGGLPASHDGGHARRSLGWCSVHRGDGQAFGSQRRRCGMMMLVK
jgi:hypothetical protein